MWSRFFDQILVAVGGEIQCDITYLFYGNLSPCSCRLLWPRHFISSDKVTTGNNTDSNGHRRNTIYCLTQEMAFDQNPQGMSYFTSLYSSYFCWKLYKKMVPPSDSCMDIYHGKNITAECLSAVWCVALDYNMM